MIEPSNPELSIGKQCQLLSISRSSFYYTPKGETAMNLMLMRQIDKQFLETPFFGVRQMTWHLRNEGHLANEERIRRLMRLMGLMPIYQKPMSQQGRLGSQDLSLSSARSASGSTQSGLGGGHHLSANAARVPVSGRHHGLAHPQGSGLAHLEHAGGRLLRRGIERGHRQVRSARDHEQRPGIAVHVTRLDGQIAPLRHAHLDGRQGAVPRQHLHRTTLAEPEIRMRLFARLGHRIRGQDWGRQVGGVLQPKAPPLRPWWQTASRGLLAEKRKNQTRSAGAKSDLTYAETCPNIGE